MSNTEALQRLFTSYGNAMYRNDPDAAEQIAQKFSAALAQPAASGEPPLFRQYVDQQVAKDMAPLYAAFATAQPAPARVPRTLTEEQLERHGYQASECPPNSQVMLVSSIRRLLGYAGTPAKEAP